MGVLYKWLYVCCNILPMIFIEILNTVYIFNDYLRILKDYISYTVYGIYMFYNNMCIWEFYIQSIWELCVLKSYTCNIFENYVFWRIVYVELKYCIVEV